MIPGGMSDLTIPEEDPPVRRCDACHQTYVITHLGDVGICRACEVAERGLRAMIADEVQIIMRDYEETVLNQIRQSLPVHLRGDV